MCLVMVTNVIFLKMLLSVLAFVPSGLDVLPWMVLVFGIVKVAKKIDAIITRIGLNPAITGDGLGGRGLPGTLTYAVVRTVGRQVARSAGRNAGGKGHGGSTAPPGGGPNGPRPGPVFGGARFSGASGTVDRPVGADTPGGQQAGAAQGSAAPQAPGNPTHSGVTQGAAAQFGGQYTDARQQNAGAYASVGGMDSVAQSTAAYDNTIDISGFVSPETKNNLDLVAYAVQAWENNWGYVWGTYGNVLTQSLFDYKLEQYPEGVGNYKDFIEDNWLGRRTADCIGLIKGYGWLDASDLTIGYAENGVPDYGANQMYQYATQNGTEGEDYGGMSTMPEIPGLMLWKDGHVGVYIGGGYVIEAMGTKYGVVKTEVEGRGWSGWCKLPYLTYLEE